MDIIEEFLLDFFLLSNKKLLTITDDSSLSRIELSNYELNLLSVVLMKILNIRICNKTSRYEYASVINNNGKTTV